MGNKQQLQLNNETLASILSNVLGLPSQDSLKHGAYVWKKYEYNQLKQEDKTSVYVSTGVEPNDSYNYIYSTSYTVDYTTGTFTLENPQTYLGNVTLSSDPPITGKYIIAISSDKLNTYISDDLKTSGKELLFIPTDASFRTSGSPAGRIVSKATSYTVSTIGDFLNFAVSDSPTAYPDGGEQGGYWYEKVVEGPSGVAIGEVTLTENTTSITIEHGLGTIPKTWLLIRPESGWNTHLVSVYPFYANNDSSTTFVLEGSSGKSPGAKGYGTDNMNDVSIKIYSDSSTYCFKAGTYTWVAIA